MVAISVVLDNDFNSPNIQIAVTGLTVGVDFTVSRIDNLSEIPTETVRGMDSTPASATTENGFDYEAPIGRSLKYRVTQGVSTADSGNVTIPYTSFGDVWISSVGTPSLSRRVVMSKFDTLEYPTNILGNYHVLGRKKPVVITDIFGSRTGDFVVVTDNDNISPTTWRDLSLLLTDGRTLMLRTAGRDFSGIEDMYFEVESYSREIVGPIRDDEKLVFLHNISFIEVDRPATAEESLGLRSYQDVKDENATYQVVKDSYDTYLDLINLPNPPGSP